MTRSPGLERTAVVATATAIALMLGTAALGPSAAEVPLGQTLDDWPLVAHAHPSPWTVTGLSLAIVAASVIGVGASLAALRRGWRPAARRLLIGSFIAIGLLVAVPPIGSADVLDYASYGHAVDHGIDPYTVAPNRQHNDSVARAVEPPWRGVTSAYGPLATAEQNLLNEIGGDRLRMTVALLVLAHGVAFALAGWVLYRVAGDDDRRRRSVILFGLNPVLLYAVVAGAHVDSLLILGIVLAFVSLRRSPGLAGVAAGGAMLVKLTGALALVGWVVALRRTPRRATALALVAGAVFTAGYAIVGWHAFHQIRRASRYASPATPWRVIRGVQVVVGHGAATAIVSLGAPLVALALMAALNRNLPDRDADTRIRLARVALMWTLGWTLTAPYVLSWYDVLPWAFIALVAASRYDKILLAHTATLAAVYVPGRAAEAVHLPHALRSLTDVLRSGAGPIVMTALVVLAFLPDIRIRAPRRFARRRRANALRPAVS